jgi:hypothetical protein
MQYKGLDIFEKCLTPLLNYLLTKIRAVCAKPSD